jgi:predicted HD phosphohydrolase
VFDMSAQRFRSADGNRFEDFALGWRDTVARKKVSAVLNHDIGQLQFGLLGALGILRC